MDYCGHFLLFCMKVTSLWLKNRVFYRLLVQLEETERTFDEFWQQHSARLHQYLELKNFEQDFKSIQTTLDRHLKTVSELTEVGETVDRVDTLIKELVVFQKLCVVSFIQIYSSTEYFWSCSPSLGKFQPALGNNEKESLLQNSKGYNYMRYKLGHLYEWTYIKIYCGNIY